MTKGLLGCVWWLSSYALGLTTHGLWVQTQPGKFSCPSTSSHTSPPSSCWLPPRGESWKTDTLVRLKSTNREEILIWKKKKGLAWLVNTLAFATWHAQKNRMCPDRIQPMSPSESHDVCMTNFRSRYTRVCSIFNLIRPQKEMQSGNTDILWFKSPPVMPFFFF